MVQVIHPDGQFFNAGGSGWSATGAASTWQAMDDPSVSPNDADYASASDASALLVVTLENATDPGDNLNHQILVRARVQGGPSAASFTLALYDDLDGAVNVVGAEAVNVTSSWATYTLPLSSVQAQALTDYDNLGIGLQFTGHTSGATLQVSLVEMVVPDQLETRLSRCTVEVVATTSIPDWRVSRLAVEVVGKYGSGYLRCSRMAVEVVAQTSTPDWHVSRLAVEVLGKNLSVPGAVKPDLRSSRLAVEVAARSEARPVVQPLPLPAELPPLFLHNWAQAFVVSTAWQSAITVADDLSLEVRWSLIDRPTRTLEAVLVGLSPDESRALLSHAWASSSGRWPFPLYSDHARIEAVTSATELVCDTATRRFFPGARVVVVSFDRHRPTAASYGVVQEVEDGLLRLAGSGVSAVVGGRVYPLIDAEVSLEPGEITYEGSRAAMVRVRATEVAGPSALPGLSRLTGPNTYRGLPILVAPIDWREPPSMAVLRPGESFTSGLAQVVYPRGLRSRMAFTLHVLGISRAAIWPVLQLFDGRRGRTRRLWAINPGTLMDVLAVEVDAITVGVEALFANLAAVQAHVSYLGVVYADGTADVREIATVGTAASTTPGYAEDWRFQLLGRISTTKAVVRVGFAHLGRFEEDSIEEEWTTPTICRTSLPFLEEVRDA